MKIPLKKGFYSFRYLNAIIPVDAHTICHLPLTGVYFADCTRKTRFISLTNNILLHDSITRKPQNYELLHYVR